MKILHLLHEIDPLPLGPFRRAGIPPTAEEAYWAGELSALSRRSLFDKAVEGLSAVGSYDGVHWTKSGYRYMTQAEKLREDLCGIPSLARGRGVICSTCQDEGTIDETLGGHSRSDPAAPCPDCSGLKAPPRPLKVGDRVRIIHNNEDRAAGYDLLMNNFVGEVVTLKADWCEEAFEVEENHWIWAYESLELVEAAP